MNRLNQDIFHVMQMYLPLEDVSQLSRVNRRFRSLSQYETYIGKRILDVLLEKEEEHFERDWTQLRNENMTLLDMNQYMDSFFETDIPVLQFYIPDFTKMYSNYQTLTRMDRILLQQLISSMERDKSQLLKNHLYKKRREYNRQIKQALENPFIREELYKVMNGNDDIQLLYETFSEIIEPFLSLEEFKNVFV